MHVSLPRIGSIDFTDFFSELFLSGSILRSQEADPGPIYDSSCPLSSFPVSLGRSNCDLGEQHSVAFGGVSNWSHALPRRDTCRGLARGRRVRRSKSATIRGLDR